MTANFHKEMNRYYDYDEELIFHEDEYSLNHNLPGYDSIDDQNYRDFYSKYKPNKLHKLSYRDHDTTGRGNELSKNDLEKIHQELNSIHHKLVTEFKLLQDRELELKKRECDLLEHEIRVTQANELNIKLKYEEIRLKQEDELEKLRNEIKEKNKENKRLMESYKMVKQNNESLKTQNVELQDKNLKLERQYNTLNNRFNNLQKKYENDLKKQFDEVNQQQTTVVSNVQKLESEMKKIQLKSLTINHNNIKITQILDILSIMVDWINETSLKTIDLNMPMSGNTKITEKFCKILPLICDFLSVQISSKYFIKFHIPFLEFIYWSLLHYDLNYLNQKITFSSVYRRIGEELYKPLMSNVKEDEFSSSNATTESDEETDDDVMSNASENVKIKKKLSLFRFIKSNNLHIRLLSCLIIIRTLNQVDYLMNVFEILRSDLKDDETKEYFLQYSGTWVLLKWCKLANKPLLQTALDTYLQLCIDTPLLEKFLSQCSNETWFSHISVLVRQLSQINNANNIDYVTIEKISILLQRLSKIKSNRKYFEMFQLNLLIHELQQKLAIINSITNDINNKDNQNNNNNNNNFLYMNLKSILFNLSQKNSS